MLVGNGPQFCPNEDCATNVQAKKSGTIPNRNLKFDSEHLITVAFIFIDNDLGILKEK